MKTSLISQCVHSMFYHLFQWYTNKIQGVSYGAIGNTIGVFGTEGTDRWLPIIPNINTVGNIINAGSESHDSIWRLKL